MAGSEDQKCKVSSEPLTNALLSFSSPTSTTPAGIVASSDDALSLSVDAVECARCPPGRYPPSSRLTVPCSLHRAATPRRPQPASIVVRTIRRDRFLRHPTTSPSHTIRLNRLRYRMRAMGLGRRTGTHNIPLSNLYQWSGQMAFGPRTQCRYSTSLRPLRLWDGSLIHQGCRDSLHWFLRPLCCTRFGFWIARAAGHS